MEFTFQHIDIVDSTNAYLQRAQGTDEISGLVVTADEQTAGKGMGNNCWESAKGMNLTFSLALNISWLPAAEQFTLSQLVPLAIIDVLDLYLPSERLKIKWPNDIYYDKHKLGGILINSTIRGSYMGDSIIGIGLNVNQMKFGDWPTHPISMKAITGKEYTLEALLKEMVASIGMRIEETRNLVQRRIPIRQTIDNGYYARLLRYNEWGEYEVGNQRQRLFMTGIDNFGRLQLLDTAQQRHNYDIKEIRFVL